MRDHCGGTNYIHGPFSSISELEQNAKSFNTESASRVTMYIDIQSMLDEYGQNLVQQMDNPDLPNATWNIINSHLSDIYSGFLVSTISILRMCEDASAIEIVKRSSGL